MQALATEVQGKFDILGITETLLTTASKTLLDLQGYHSIFRRDRSQGNEPGGGVALYVSETLAASRKEEFELPNIETLCAEVVIKHCKVLVCVCYRPPNTGVTFWDDFQDTFDSIRRAGYDNILITGDINADPKTANGTKLQFFVNSNSLNMHVQEPTRITAHSATILDQFISTGSLNIENITVSAPLATSDHCQISCSLNKTVPKHPCHTRLVWSYNRADWEGLNNAIQNFDWEPCFEPTSVNDVASRITHSFLNLARQFIPNKVATIRPQDKPWYNNTLRALKRRRDRLFTKAKTLNTPAAWDNYRQCRNTYVHSIQDAKQEHDLKQTNELNDQSVGSKSWWQTIKKFIGGAKSDTIPALLLPSGAAVHDNTNKAKMLNDYFASHSTIDDSNATLPPENTPQHEQLNNIQVNETEVRDILKSLKCSKASGPDGISPRMLKETANYFSVPLARLLNLSLQEGVFPQVWKQANVIPIFKKGDKSLPKNYRPVSLLSILGKVMEKIIFKHMYNYLKDHDTIYKYQSGFLPGHSTTHHLAHLYHIMTQAFDQQKKIRLVFGDISKAFDKIWHAGLVHKLKAVGFTGPLNVWLADYLNNRQQRVVLQGASSDWTNINAGVPQGSVLGPLLFLIYINDMSVGLESNLSLFADDNLLYMTSDSHDLNATILNRDIVKIQRWAKQWLVTFNPDKTHSMFISFYDDPPPNPLYMYDQQLSDATESLHLGVTLQHNLKWDRHIENICIKAHKRLDILNSVSFTLNRRTLDTLYKSYVRSVLEYADIVLCNSTQDNLDKLNKVQKRAGKIVSGAIRGTSSETIYNELSWETLETRREKRMLVFYSDIIHNRAPPYLQSHIPQTVQERTQGRYNLRTNNNLTQPAARTETFKNSYFPTMVTTWNTTDQTITSIPTRSALRNTLNCHNPKPNPYFTLGRRKLNIVLARMRMECSELNSHLFAYHVIPSPHCECGGGLETNTHYFLECPLYTVHRTRLIGQLRLLEVNLSLDNLLYRTSDTDLDQRITTLVDEFIVATNRFQLLR